MAANIINDIEVYCNNEGRIHILFILIAKGCKWMGNIKELETHYKACIYSMGTLPKWAQKNLKMEKDKTEMGGKENEESKIAASAASKLLIYLTIIEYIREKKETECRLRSIWF